MRRSSLSSEEELEVYEGDEDVYVDQIKNSPRKCSRINTTLVMGSKISLRSNTDEEKFNSNVILFIRVKSDGTHEVDCFLYSEFKDFLNSSSTVFLWQGGDLGTPLEDFPIYLLPIQDPSDQEIWFEGNYGMLSRYTAFLIYEPRQMKIGSSFSSSSRHGDLEYVWKVRPISKIHYLKTGQFTPIETVFSDSLDFSPGNYPGYDVLVKMVGIEVPNQVCMECQTLVECPVTNIFYRNGDTIVSFLFNNKYAVKTRLEYEKVLLRVEDIGDVYILTGKRKVLGEYVDQISCRFSRLHVDKISENELKITYTIDDQIIWRDTIICDDIKKKDVNEENEEIHENHENEENHEIHENHENEENHEIHENHENEENEETEEIINMNTIFSTDEIDTHVEDMTNEDKIVIIEDNYIRDNGINRFREVIIPSTTILCYNISYYPEFKLPDPQDTPLLKRLVIFIKPPIGDEHFSGSEILIPYYPHLEYLSIRLSKKFKGKIRFAFRSSQWPELRLRNVSFTSQGDYNRYRYFDIDGEIE